MCVHARAWGEGEMLEWARTSVHEYVSFSFSLSLGSGHLAERRERRCLSVERSLLLLLLPIVQQPSLVFSLSPSAVSSDDGISFA